MDVKCPGCYKITTVFSHAQTVVLCVGCSTVSAAPLPAHGRKGEAYRRMLLQAEAALKAPGIKMSGTLTQ
ncbi:unnamed protein product [Gulo gulo]|uniref:40S ribosomal protein S27 n=1 Tax=Gulo gulo TaxID=48420 RepID=A0A9X9PTB0_GULGU|nr:unnamed protein product [Gulo gulo]